MSWHNTNSTFTFKPLTKDDAAAISHIAWIEESDPIKAVRELINVYKNPQGYNCAIWAQANDDLSENQKTLLRTWRQHNAVDIYATLYDKDFKAIVKDGFDTKQELMNDLTLNFNKAASTNADHPEGLTLLKNIITRRIDQIYNAASIKKAAYQMRASRKTRHTPNTHTDGSFGPRLIESLLCPSTMLVANSDIEYRAITPEDIRRYEHITGFSAGVSGPQVGNREWFFKPDREVTFWQIPENALTLLMGTKYMTTPPIHSEAVIPKEQPPQNRTVFVYDFVI